MFVITLNHLGNTFWLRSTVWTATEDRATKYTSEDAAKEGLRKAAKFMKATQYSKAKIAPAAGDEK